MHAIIIIHNHTLYGYNQVIEFSRNIMECQDMASSYYLCILGPMTYIEIITSLLCHFDFNVYASTQ